MEITNITKTRGFEIVSRYVDDFVYTQEQFDAQVGEDKKPLFIQPHRATKKSACYDIYNQTGADIVLEPNEISSAITTYVKAYMLDDEVLKAFVRSGHGFKFSVRLANSTGIIDCVPKGTLIETPSGKIPVEDLMDRKNAIVYSYNEETNELEEDTITDMWIVNDLPLIKIKTTESEIVIPETKEVFTKRGWIQAKSLTEEDEILSL